jgi:SAM-dependent methyltransferase
MYPLQEKWDGIYRKVSGNVRPEPALVLRQYDYLLPSQGRALDLACGMGGNALFLAERGLSTTAWDLSAVAIERLSQVVATDQLDLVCEARDLEKEPPAQSSFDVVVVSRFLDRNLNRSLAAALRPGGLLYFQTFVADKDPAIGPENPAYLLRENELATTFADLILRAYCEVGQTGDRARGFRNEALLVGQKPLNTVEQDDVEKR